MAHSSKRLNRRAPAAEFGRVMHPFSRFAIVAMGPSAGEADLSKIGPHVTVIAVNAAIRYVPRAELWTTMDPSEKNLRLMKYPRPGVHYYAAVPEKLGRPHRRYQSVVPYGPHLTYLRRVFEITPAVGIINERLAEDPGSLQSGNSAFGALNLAYHGVGLSGQTEARGILLGVDGGGTYAFGERGRSGDLAVLPELFACSIPQLQRRGIEILNGSPDSTVTCFPRVPGADAIAWVNG